VTSLERIAIGATSFEEGMIVWYRLKQYMYFDGAMWLGIGSSGGQ
jgi:hypothetical protein